MLKKNILYVLIASSTLSMCADTIDTQNLLKKPATSAKTAFLTAGAGAATYAGVLAGLSWLCNYFNVTDIPLFFGIGGVTNVGPVQVSASVGTTVSATPKYIIAACGLAFGSLAAWLTYRSLPEGKFGRAHATLKNVLQNEQLVQNLAACNASILANIDNEYITHTYPRVAAHNEFLTYLVNLEKAESLFKEAMLNGDTEVAEPAENCLKVVQNCIVCVKKCIQIIRNEPNWQEQLNGYNVMLARQAQERAAITAQHMAINGAFCHCY